MEGIRTQSEIFGNQSAGIKTPAGTATAFDSPYYKHALRESEDRYRSLFNHMTEGFALCEVICDEAGQPVDFRFLASNPAMKTHTGLSPEHVVGKTVREFAPEITDRALRRFADVAITGVPTSFDMPSERFQRHLEFHVFRPATRQFAILVRDISERKRIERELYSTARFPLENPNPVLRAQLNGEIVFANQASEPFLKEWGCEVHGFLPPEWREAISRAGATKTKGSMDLTCGDRVFSVLIAPVEQADYVNLYGREITDTIQAEKEIHDLNAELEKRVAQRTAELQAANKELEAFSYSVSHDLRAPLRTVDGFSEVLMEDFGEQLPDEAKRLLHVVREGAQRMGRLIDELLTFSRLGRQGLNIVTVDTDAMVREIFGELTAHNPERRITVRFEEIPSCRADRPLLRQVWVNLLSNAIKYTGRKELAAIEVGAMQKDGRTVYFVRDNGTGFDMRYAGKLFGVFQRLHRAEDFEGTGVGLAIVRRIVHRHGGEAWAEGEKDKGATFYFTL